MTFDMLPTTDRSGRPLEVTNAKIESVKIDNENHGCLTAWLFLRWGCSGCGFGGYKLGHADKPNAAAKAGQPDYMAEFVRGCLNVVYDDGFGTWDGLVGQPVRILHEGLGGGVVAIGHLFDDKWFCPRVQFAETPGT